MRGEESIPNQKQARYLVEVIRKKVREKVLHLTPYA